MQMSYGNYRFKREKRVLVVVAPSRRCASDLSALSELKVVPQAQIDAFIYAETLPMLEGILRYQIFIYDRRLKKRPLFSRLVGEAKLLVRFIKLV
jgi:hypothetical protein